MKRKDQLKLMGFQSSKNGDWAHPDGITITRNEVINSNFYNWKGLIKDYLPEFILNYLKENPYTTFLEMQCIYKDVFKVNYPYFAIDWAYAFPKWVEIREKYKHGNINTLRNP